MDKQTYLQIDKWTYLRHLQRDIHAYIYKPTDRQMGISTARQTHLQIIYTDRHTSTTDRCSYLDRRTPIDGHT